MADDPLNSLRQATEKEIREHYRKRDLEVRISHDGFVRYRKLAFSVRDTREWLNGGYVDNYHVDSRGEVHLI